VARADVGQTSLGQGVLTLVTRCGGMTDVVAREPDTSVRADTVRVVATNCYGWVPLRIVDGSGQVVDTLRAATDDTIRLHAQGRRADNGEWVSATVEWHVQGDLSTGPPPAEPCSTWTFQGQDTGTGWVSVAFVDSCGRIHADSVWIVIARESRVAGRPGQGSVVEHPRAVRDAPRMSLIDLRGRKVETAAGLCSAGVYFLQPAAGGRPRPSVGPQ
jgi:hypothetical protein